jgi:hypothetical protein
MPQKRGEVVEKLDASEAVPNVYEDWLDKQVRAKYSSLTEKEDDEEEDEIDKAEDQHEKARRRKRGRGSAASSA